MKIRQYFPYMDDMTLIEYEQPERPSEWIRNIRFEYEQQHLFILMLVDDNGECVGAAHIITSKDMMDSNHRFLIKKGRAYIQHLTIAPEYRHKGKGQELLNKALDYVRQKQCTECALAVYSDDIVTRHICAKYNFVKPLLVVKTSPNYIVFTAAIA